MLTPKSPIIASVTLLFGFFVLDEVDVHAFDRNGCKLFKTWTCAGTVYTYTYIYIICVYGRKFIYIYIYIYIYVRECFGRICINDIYIYIYIYIYIQTFVYMCRCLQNIKRLQTHIAINRKSTHLHLKYRIEISVAGCWLKGWWWPQRKTKEASLHRKYRSSITNI